MMPGSENWVVREREWLRRLREKTA